MINVTFDLSSMHQHGTAFWEFLKLRKRFFVDTLGWDIPHNNDVEMDQYDTPVAHYSIVLRDGQVVGGARVMPTTSVWGSHSYMLRDAWLGKLADIPPQVIDSEIRTPAVWECTRLVVSDELQTQAERSECLALILDGVVQVARRNGADRLISLSPVTMTRVLRQIGHAANRIGEPYACDGDGRRYAVLSMPAERSATAIAATTHPLERPQAAMAAS